MPNKFNNLLSADGATMDEFKKLTRIPIILYYGDFIPESGGADNPAQDYWHAAMQMASKWAATVNKYGGHVTVVHLPKVRIKVIRTLGSLIRTISRLWTTCPHGSQKWLD